jgi:hypothetical protein
MRDACYKARTEATESLEPRPIRDVRRGFSSTAAVDIDGQSDPAGRRDPLVILSSRRIEKGLGTKTEALLASDMSILEIDELRPLILEGQERGFLTFEQITSCLEEVEVTKEQVAELHSYLEDQLFVFLFV